LPVYLLTQGTEISLNWSLVLIATAGVVLGTLLGKHVLARMSQAIFRRVIALLLIGLGLYMVRRGLL
ncbi:MAG TPA: TSUP family transporter, partial [Gemmatimonadales bacterium]|nr:TSUP family transporter [Gemmatimonadales bacterium]